MPAKKKAKAKVEAKRVVSDETKNARAEGRERMKQMRADLKEMTTQQLTNLLKNVDTATTGRISKVIKALDDSRLDDEIAAAKAKYEALVALKEDKPLFDDE